MIHIVTGADEGFAPGLLAAVSSALFSLPPSRPVTVHVLDGGLSKKSSARLRAAADRIHPGCRIQFCPVDVTRFAGFRSGIGNSRMYYARLVIGELVCADKVIYLDADVVVTGCLEDLWNWEMGGNLVLAAEDRKLRLLRDDCPWPLPDEESPYFNTGVMAIDLREWRKENVGARAIALAAEAGDKCQWYDQTVLNYLLRGRIGLLPDFWNWQREEIPADAPVGAIHFTTGKKPWLYFGPDARFRIWRAFYSLAGSPLIFLRRKAIPGLCFGVFETLLRRLPLLRSGHVFLLQMLCRTARDPERKRALLGSIFHYTTGPGGPGRDREIGRDLPVIAKVRSFQLLEIKRRSAGSTKMGTQASRL